MSQHLSKSPRDPKTPQAGDELSECSQDQTNGDSGEHDHGNSARLMDLELDPQAMDQSDSDLDVDAWMTEGLDEEESNDNAVAEEEQGVAQEEGEESDAVASAEQADGSVRAMGGSNKDTLAGTSESEKTKNSRKKREKRDRLNKKLKNKNPRYRRHEVETKLKGKKNRNKAARFQVARKNNALPLRDGGGIVIGRIPQNSKKKMTVKINRGAIKTIRGEPHAFAHAVGGVKIPLKKKKSERKKGEKTSKLGSASGWIALSYFRGAGKKFLQKKAKNPLTHAEDDFGQEGASYSFKKAPGPKNHPYYEYKVVRGSKATNEQLGDYMRRPDNSIVLSLATPGNKAIATNRFLVDGDYEFVEDLSTAQAQCHVYKPGEQDGERASEKAADYKPNFIFGKVINATNKITLGIGFMLDASLTKIP